MAARLRPASTISGSMNRLIARVSYRWSGRARETPHRARQQRKQAS
jgi:hypothetical protein